MKKTLLAVLSITALLAVVAALPADDPVESLRVKVESLRAKVAVAEAKTLEMRELACQLVAQQKQPEPNKPLPKKFKRGAHKTPLPKILTAFRTGRAIVHKVVNATPSQVAMVPKKLSMWGNDQYGDCVSAESAGAMAAYSVYVGLPEIFIPEATLIAWAQSHGFADGADLLSVIQAMESDGIKDDGGTLRKEGTASSVDYTSENVLKNAISIGPVSIAIDANALPNGAGNASGWYAFGGSPGQFGNTDHCVGLWGYGPTKFLCDALGLGAVPPGAPANCYLLFTWDTIGLVDYPWLMSTCQEAWLRTPTVVGLTPTPPPPPPNPTPTGTFYTMSTAADGTITFTPAAAPSPNGGLTPNQQQAVQASIQACNAAVQALQAAFPQKGK